MTSRKIDTQTNRDKLFSAWSIRAEVKTFTEIRDHLIKEDVFITKKDPIEHHTTLSRWLKTLEKERVIKKVEGGYRLMLNPQEFQLFNYLSHLRTSGPKIYEGTTGGGFYNISAMSIFGFPEDSLGDEDALTAFYMLSIRLGEIFSAFECLRNVVVIRKAGKDALMPDTVDREVFFAILDKHIGKEGTTDELVLKYRKKLEGYYNSTTKEYWRAEYSDSAKKYFLNTKKYPRPELNYYDFYKLLRKIKVISRKTEIYMETLKSKNFHMDKHALDGELGLMSKLELFKNKENINNEERAVLNQLELAVLIKLAENIKKMNIDFDDFAIILTNPPSSMDKFNTAEHVLYDAMIYALEEPQDKLLKEIWKEKKEQLKTNEAMIVNYLKTYKFNVEDYRKLRSKPFVIKRLNQYADFEKILAMYSEFLKP